MPTEIQKDSQVLTVLFRVLYALYSFKEFILLTNLFILSFLEHLEPWDPPLWHLSYLYVGVQ